MQLISQDLIHQEEITDFRQLRIKAFAAESDPLFFMWQRGEATKDEWLSKIEEIKTRFPGPEVVAVEEPVTKKKVKSRKAGA